MSKWRSQRPSVLKQEPMSQLVQNGTFAGRVNQSRVLRDVTVAETSYSSGARVGMHAHEHPMCCLVLDGGFVEHHGTRSAECNSGSLLFHPAGQDHAHDFGASTICFNLQLANSQLRILGDEGLQLPDAPVIVQSGDILWLAWRARLASRDSDSGSELIFEESVASLLATLARAPRRTERRYPHWLRSVIERLDCDFADRPTLQVLAEVAGVRSEYVVRTFHRYVGCTPGEYVRKRQVEQARRDLERSESSLSRIAFDCGFADQAHFTRVFRARVGFTPGNYRRITRRSA